MNWTSTIEGFRTLVSLPFVQLMAGLFLLAIAGQVLLGRKTRKGRRNHSSQWAELFEIVSRLLFLAALTTGPAVLAWFSERPWAMPLAVFTTITGLLGLIMFLITWRQVHRQETQRRLLALESWQNLSAADFEEYVAALFRARGYQARVTGGTSDGGIDIHLKKGDAKAIAQCKRYLSGKKVGVKDMREFEAVLNRSGATEGYFVTTSNFTHSALDWAKREPIILIDGNGLFEWMKEAKQGAYTHSTHPLLFFSAGQWLVITLLAVTAIGLLGFLAGILMWG